MPEGLEDQSKQVLKQISDVRGCRQTVMVYGLLHPISPNRLLAALSPLGGILKGIRRWAQKLFNECMGERRTIALFPFHFFFDSFFEYARTFS